MAPSSAAAASESTTHGTLFGVIASSRLQAHLGRIHVRAKLARARTGLDEPREIALSIAVEGLVRLEQAPAGLGIPGDQTRRLVVQRVESLGERGKGFHDQHAEHVLQGSDRLVLARIHRRGDPLSNLLHGRDHRVDEQILLGLVVVVERSLAHPGATRDLFHRGRIESLLCENLLGGGEDPRALVALAAGLTGRSRSGRGCHFLLQY
jgi:hypothetical protein